MDIATRLQRLSRTLQAAKYGPIRTPEPGEPRIYHLNSYHATLRDRWPSIRRKGLVPGHEDPAGQDWKGTYSGIANYFHLQFPQHELDNSVDGDDFWVIVIEFNFRIGAGYVVPDEEAGTPEETERTIRNHSPVAVAIRIPPTDISALHLPDIPAAHEWAKKNVGRFWVEYHHVF